MALLDFERLRLIKELLRNRTKIVWCMRLARARDDNESARIEASPYFQSSFSKPYVSGRGASASGGAPITLKE